MLKRKKIPHCPHIKQDPIKVIFHKIHKDELPNTKLVTTQDGTIHLRSEFPNGGKGVDLHPYPNSAELIHNLLTYNDIDAVGFAKGTHIDSTTGERKTYTCLVMVARITIGKSNKKHSFTYVMASETPDVLLATIWTVFTQKMKKTSNLFGKSSIVFNAESKEWLLGTIGHYRLDDQEVDLAKS